MQNGKPDGDFRELTVYKNYGWKTVGKYGLLRELCKQGRATEAVATEDDKKASIILPGVMLLLNDDEFRSVLTFLL